MIVTLVLTEGTVEVYDDDGDLVETFDAEQIVGLAEELVTAVEALGALAGRRRRRWSRFARVLRRL